MSSVKLKSLLFLIATLFILSACGGDEEAEIVEDRLVTTLRFTLGTSGGADPIVLSYRDLDGTGGDAPIINGGSLTANSIYFGSLELLNESENPVVDVVSEIEADKEAHQFFFIISDLDMVLSYADLDGEGNPIGLFTAIKTGMAGSGTITINLQRGLNKYGTGVSDGQIANAGGKTDVQVSFPVTIQ